MDIQNVYISFSMDIQNVYISFSMDIQNVYRITTVLTAKTQDIITSIAASLITKEDGKPQYNLLTANSYISVIYETN
jgi:hypothetical protein